MRIEHMTWNCSYAIAPAWIATITKHDLLNLVEVYTQHTPLPNSGSFTPPSYLLERRAEQLGALLVRTSVCGPRCFPGHFRRSAELVQVRATKQVGDTGSRT